MISGSIKRRKLIFKNGNQKLDPVKNTQKQKIKKQKKMKNEQKNSKHLKNSKVQKKKHVVVCGVVV